MGMGIPIDDYSVAEFSILCEVYTPCMVITIIFVEIKMQQKYSFFNSKHYIFAAS